MNKLIAILASLRTLPTLLARMADLEEDNRRLRDDLAGLDRTAMDLAEKTGAPAALAYAAIAAKWLAVPVCAFFATAAADLI